jgi:regulator of sirC expression with transglutaminase-like and TPR domain
MSWIGWCIIFAAIYAGYLLLRATIDGINWMLDTFVREPREREKLQELARQRRKNAAAASAPTQADAANSIPVIPMIPKERGPEDQ